MSEVNLVSIEEIVKMHDQLALGTGVVGKITYAELAKWLQANTISIS